MNPAAAASDQSTGVPSATNSSPPGVARRLMSLDALRGFDMFWIVGGDELAHSLYAAWPIAPLFVLDQQMDHKAWAGLAFYDLIFPLFVFIVGVSTVFSLSRALERDGLGSAFKRIVLRSLFLYIFGLLVYGGISKGFDQIRWLGVLQRIAICYFFAASTFCFFRWRGIAAICAGVLLGYWALVSFVPIRDFNLQKAHLEQQHLSPNSPETRALFLATTNYVTGRFDDGENLPNHVDYLYLPGYKWDGAYDPEGLLSTLPAICTCLLGLLAGLLLRNGSLTDQQKCLYLLLGGVSLLVVGFLWSFQFPIIKKIWTSSYVLMAAGYACLFLALFHLVIEVWNFRKWCTPFLWIGMNAITIYLGAHFLQFDKLARLLVGGPIEKAAGSAGPLVVHIVAVLLMFALVRFLYRRKIFLRL